MEIHIPLPEFVVELLERLQEWYLFARTSRVSEGIQFVYRDIVLFYYSRIQDVMADHRMAVPVLIGIFFFWPVLLSIFMVFSTASTWVFWLVTSFILGILQMVYVAYHFVMIVIDILGVSILKTYSVIRSNIFYYLGDKLKVHSSLLRNQRMEWKQRLENAGTYEGFLKIPIQKATVEIEAAELRRKQRKDNTNDNHHHHHHKAKALSRSSSFGTLNRDNTSSTSTSTDAIVTSASDELATATAAAGIIESSPSLSPTRKHIITRNRSFGALGEDTTLMDTSIHNNNLHAVAGGLGLEVDADIVHELGEMTTVMLTTTNTRLKEARQAAVKESDHLLHQQPYNPDAAKSLKILLSGVVKRNHLTIENILLKNARSIAASGQYGISSKSRKLLHAHYEEIEKGLDWIAESPVPTDTATATTTSTAGGSLRNGVVVEEGEEDLSDDEENMNDDDTKIRLLTTELSDRMTLIRKMKANIGRTALMLSGGGAQAMYHLGTVRALLESKTYEDITVISGTSGGSITAAMCAIKTPEELLKHVCVPNVSTDYMLNGEMKKKNIRWFPKVTDMCAYWLKHKLLVDSALFRQTCEFYFGDYTFEEAFERTGKNVCITVSASRASGDTAQRLLLNHISTPHVTIASAVAASCALPGVMAPAKLKTKDNRSGKLEPFEVDGVEWIDGSVQADLPFQRISTLFNVSNFIVCQTNFHVLPFLHKAHHPTEESLYWRLFQLFEWDIRNRALQLSRLGLFPKLFGQDISKVFKQKYHGNLTIVPRFTPAQTFGLKALVNPTVKEMEGYLKYGQMAVWPYVNVIRDMIRLEKALDDCLLRLQERFRDIYPEFGADDIDSIASSSLPSTNYIHASNRVKFVVGGGGGGSRSFAESSEAADKYKQKAKTLEHENATLKQQIRQLQQLLEKTSNTTTNSTDNNNNNNNKATTTTTTDAQQQEDTNSDEIKNNNSNDSENKILLKILRQQIEQQ